MNIILKEGEGMSGFEITSIILAIVAGILALAGVFYQIKQTNDSNKKSKDEDRKHEEKMKKMDENLKKLDENLEEKRLTNLKLEAETEY